MAGKVLKQAEVDTIEEALRKEWHAAKTVDEQTRAFGKLAAHAELYATVRMPGLDNGSFKALAQHLRDVRISIERFEAKTGTEHAGIAVGGRLRELRQEESYLVRTLRRREDEILHSISDVQG